MKHKKGCLLALNWNYKQLYSFNKYISLLLPPKKKKIILTLCCNLSGDIGLIMWFTTNGMCVKDNTIIYLARASNSKRDCDVKPLLMFTFERLNMMTSVREKRLRAWSLLLLAATVRRFARSRFSILQQCNTFSDIVLTASINIALLAL